MIYRDKIGHDIFYTHNSGWIDTKHAAPGPAQNLWAAMNTSTPYVSEYEPEGFKVTFRAMMGPFSIGINVVEKSYFVKSGVDEDMLQSISLGIFMDVRDEFEDLQGMYSIVGLVPYINKAARSSWSIEDPISNLISWYVGVRGLVWESSCGLVPNETALAIFDQYKDHINSTRGTLRPVLYPSDYNPNLVGPTDSPLPAFLNSVNALMPTRASWGDRPAKGAYLRTWTSADEGRHVGRRTSRPN